jgi:hypothetical protein
MSIEITMSNTPSTRNVSEETLSVPSRYVVFDVDYDSIKIELLNSR